MGRPKKSIPEPSKRFHQGGWRIYWRGRGRKYEAAIGKVSEDVAEQTRLAAALALRDAGSWPPLMATSPAVIRWERGEDEAGQLDCRADALLASYRAVLERELESAGWAQTSLNYLRKLAEIEPDLMQLTPRAADEAFSALTGDRAAGTRNKYVQVFSKFYNWAKKNGYCHQNPWAGIKYARERRRQEDIVYLTRDEREAVLALADQEKQGLAVYLALLGGLRRQAVWELRRSHINLENETIFVPDTMSKTESRTVPMSDRLAEVLRARGRKRGHLVPRLHHNNYRSASRAFLDMFQRKAAKAGVDPDLVGWNAWRHTYATMYVQAGVPIELIAAWMGNSVDVCRRWYARFVPKDHKDPRVNLG